MAINNYTTTLREWENIIRVNLKVTNPALLKSGALGILSNYLASIKFDTLQFYSKTFQELNPGLAQDFNSLLYHASIYGAEIQFATAGTLSATLIVPEIMLSHVNTLVYDIPQNTKLLDTNNIPFIAIADIRIEQKQMSITATAWDEINGTQKLSITKAPNPNVPGKYVYLIHSGNFQQYQRTFHTNVILEEPVVGVPYEFEIGVPNLNEIKQVRVWSNTGEHMSLNQLENAQMDTLAATNENITELNIKFYKFESSTRDEDIFLEMFPNSLTFETGDGVHGALQEQGSQLMVELDTTLGSSGNVPNSEFLISGVNVTEKWGNDSLKYYQTVLNGMSAAGAIGGKSVQNIEAIRDDIFTRISVRSSVITENDYEAMFQFQGVRPFVDAKFIDAQAFVFLFNVIRNNDFIVPSTAVNYLESQLLANPFYPEIDYAGYRLISPFYYKTLDNNRLDAYMINPHLDISIRGDLRTPDPSTLKDYKVELAVTYDFVTNSSYLEVISGAQDELEYYFVCDQFRVTVSSDNNDNTTPFTYKISQLFTDEYCVLNEPITGVVLHVKDKQGRVLASYSSDATYNQLIKKQTFYKYFQEVEEVAGITRGGAVPADAKAYLDNINNNAMTTYDGLHSQTAEANARIAANTENTSVDQVDKYILRMPFISSDYFFSKTPQETFETFNAYFIMNLTEEFLNYNTLATQSFHNTIDIPPKYYASLFERNTMPVLSSPKIPIEVEIHGDRVAMMTSKFDSATELDTAIRIEIIKFLKLKEGFTIEFFETDLEKHIYDTFDPLLKNVTVLSPTLFQVNSSAEIYRSIQESLEFIDVLNFIPPYFYYDYANMSLSITW